MEIGGAGGANCGNYGGNGCGTAGTVEKESIGEQSNLANRMVTGYEFSIELGQSGRTYNGQAAASHNGKGGRAGDGHNNNDGGGGGAASIFKYSNTIIGGAGGVAAVVDLVKVHVVKMAEMQLVLPMMLWK